MRVLELRQMLLYGNLGRLIVRTAAYLRTRGFAVDILLFYNRSRARLLGMDQTALPAIHPLIADAKSKGVTAWQVLDHGPLSLQPLLALVRAIKREHYDLLHTHDLKTDVLGLLVGRLTGIPVVATAHGYPRAVRRNQLYRRIDVLALRLCQHVICVSDGLRQELLASGLDGCRLTVVYNGIDVEDVCRRADAVPHTLRQDLPVQPEDAIIMAVGRLSAEKGHTFLLRAIKLVARQHAHLCLVVVGDGPLRDSLANEVKDLGIADRVFFLGFRADAPALMAQSDMVVNASLNEALGNVLLEAMALGKPVIGADSGGMPELIGHQQTGLIVPAADAAALAAAIVQILDHPQEARRMGQRGSERVRSYFTVERMADGLQAVFTAAAHGHDV